MQLVVRRVTPRSHRASALAIASRTLMPKEPISVIFEIPDLSAVGRGDTITLTTVPQGCGTAMRLQGISAESKDELTVLATGAGGLIVAARRDVAHFILNAAPNGVWLAW